MASEWKTLSLADAGVQLIDCDHRTPPATETGYPYIAIPQLKDGRIELGDVRLISAEDYAGWTRKLKPRAHDVIVVRRCNSGQSAVVPEGLECAIGQNLVVLRSDGKKVNPGYLRWLVRGTEWWSEVQKHINVGAVFDSLKCRDIPKFSVKIPGLEEQAEIAAILGALDDRIDNLHQTNATLQGIAAALFKSRFADFDGVPPEGMQESELGLIPKGWQVEEIGRLVQCVGGATPSTKDDSFWQNGTHHWATPKDLSGLRAPVLTTTERLITDTGVARISSGLLPVGTLLMSSRAPIGYLAIAAVPVAINQGFIAMPPGGALSPAWLLFWAMRNMEAIKQKANGSTFMEISKAAFRPIKVVVPPPDALAQFDDVVTPMLERIKNNVFHAATLTALRDTLLPRLVSGRLRAREAVRTAEQTA